MTMYILWLCIMLFMILYTIGNSLVIIRLSVSNLQKLQNSCKRFEAVIYQFYHTATQTTSAVLIVAVGNIWVLIIYANFLRFANVYCDLLLSLEEY